MKHYLKDFAGVMLFYGSMLNIIGWAAIFLLHKELQIGLPLYLCAYMLLSVYSYITYLRYNEEQNSLILKLVMNLIWAFIWIVFFAIIDEEIKHRNSKRLPNGSHA